MKIAGRVSNPDIAQPGALAIPGKLHLTSRERQIFVSDIVDRGVADHFQLGPLEVVDANYTGEVAERWRYVDGAGEIGVISSVTQAFCSTCNRMRLSTEGSLFTCLFGQSGHDLKALVRGGASDEAIRNEIAAVWQQRADRYSEIRTEATSRERKVEMSYIGG